MNSRCGNPYLVFLKRAFKGNYLFVYFLWEICIQHILYVFLDPISVFISYTNKKFTNLVKKSLLFFMNNEKIFIREKAKLQ